MSAGRKADHVGTPIRFLRIDDRLVHGQVIVGWLPHLGTQSIIVANDRVAGDPMRQEMMRLAVPSDVEIDFRTPAALGSDQALPHDSLVLVASPKDAWACLQGGLAPEILNVGGLHARPGKAEIFEALHLDDEDRRHFQSIIAAGHRPVFQPTPQNEPIPLEEIL